MTRGRKVQGFCATCRVNARAAHYMTARHREATRSRDYRGGAGAWLDSWAATVNRGLRAEQYSDEDNAAAAVRLGIEWAPARGAIR